MSSLILVRVRECFCKRSTLENVFEQILIINSNYFPKLNRTTSQLYGLVFKWINLCLVKRSFFLNSFEQTSHLWVIFSFVLLDFLKSRNSWILVSLLQCSILQSSFIFGDIVTNTILKAPKTLLWCCHNKM